MADKGFDFSFIKDDTGVNDVEQNEKTITISKSEFFEKTSKVSKQILEDMERVAKEHGKNIDPLSLMNEMLTHALLLARITDELFDGGEENG